MIVSVLEDKLYLLWQQEVQMLNLRELGVTPTVVILHSGEPSDYAKSLSSLGNVFFYKNDCPVKHYSPINKPWGLYKLLYENPQFGKEILLVDSDVYFRELPTLDKEKGWAGANCDSYLGYDYIVSKISEEELKTLSSDIIDFDLLRATKGAGAQYYLTDIDYLFCLQVSLDSVKLYNRLKVLSEKGSEIQIWTAEMWSWLWNCAKLQGIYISPELDFSWATDSLDKFEKHKLLHVAGVTSKDMGVFYKGAYTNTKPWDNRDYGYITKKDNCGWKYLQEIGRLKGVEITT